MECILQNSRAAIDDSTLIIEAQFAPKFAGTGLVDDLMGDTLDELPEQAVDDHVEDETHNEGIGKE